MLNYGICMSESQLNMGCLENYLYSLYDNGVVIVESPKIRKRIYNSLEQQGIKWDTEIIGYTTGYKSIGRSSSKLGWDLGRIAKWIKAKRITYENLEEACNTTNYFNFDDIKDVFNGTMTSPEIYNIIKDKWGEKLIRIGYTPFDMCILRKTIVKITLN